MQTKEARHCNGGEWQGLLLLIYYYSVLSYLPLILITYPTTHSLSWFELKVLPPGHLVRLSSFDSDSKSFVCLCSLFW
jgi:hypothetical protein